MPSSAANVQSVLITGASAGIGAQTARLLCAKGFRVFGTSRREMPSTGGVEMLRLDVGSAESVRDCVAEVVERVGRIDVLINNAGMMHQGYAEETTLDEAREVFDTNLFGAMRVTNAVLPGMRVRRSGRVVNVGSLAAWVGEPGEAVYAASKAALARYTQALRYELRPLGIQVSLVEPGAFRTGITAAAPRSTPSIKDYDGLREPARDRLEKSLRRGGDPAVAARRVIKVVEARSPRFRYSAGGDGRWVPYLTTLLPQRLVDRLLMREYGLPTGPPSR